MAILKYLYIILAAVSLTACFEDFTPEIDTAPVLCMNSMITAGEPIDVKVTRTWLYTDNAYGTRQVKDATVKIFANGVAVASDYIPQEGDLIKLVAESPCYGMAEAEVRVPVAVPIGELGFNPIPVSLWKNETDDMIVAWVYFNLKAELKINDIPRTDNYFGYTGATFFTTYRDENIYRSPENPRVSLYEGTFRYEAEPIFSEHIGVFESIMGGDSYGFTFFTDRQFSGSSYTLHLLYTDCCYSVCTSNWDDRMLDCGFEMTLYTVSESYYNWACYLWQRDDGPLGDISELGFGDPMWGYSNVSTGAGVVAARSASVGTIDLRDFLRSQLDK